MERGPEKALFHFNIEIFFSLRHFKIMVRDEKEEKKYSKLL